MQRYDRQIRLWSQTGQADLENSTVIIVGCSLAIAEIVKNLALAGVGELVLLNELGETALQYPLYQDVKSLNDRVRIHSNLPSTVDLVIMEHSCSNYEQWLKYDSPIIIVKSSMMRASVAIEIGNSSIYVLEPHPPSGLADLRFDALWPELSEFCDSFDLDSLDDTEHSHVPFCVLLAKAKQESSSFEDIKEYLAKSRRYHIREENFEEAIKNMHRLKHEAVPTGIKELFEIARGGLFQIGSNDKQFWNHVSALEKFVAKHHCLPVSGDIPDMFCTSELYVKLQEIYRRKHEKDTNELLSLLHRDGNSNLSFTKKFSKNCRYVKVALPPSTLAGSKHRVWNHDDFPNADDYELKELAPVSSIIGGIAAQEALKLLMKQYTPMLSIISYDGLQNKTEVFSCGTKFLN